MNVTIYNRTLRKECLLKNVYGLGHVSIYMIVSGVNIMAKKVRIQTPILLMRMVHLSTILTNNKISCLPVSICRPPSTCPRCHSATHI